jgi:methionine-rich copper-binding protein CopC
MKTTKRLALATLATVFSPFAFAHASLVTSSPAKAQVLDAPPIEIRLTFNEHVEARFCRIKLVSGDGRNIDADRPHPDKTDPNAIVASVPVLRAGTYSARWTAVGGDGHKTHGDFPFTIKK